MASHHRMEAQVNNLKFFEKCGIDNTYSVHVEGSYQKQHQYVNCCKDQLYKAIGLGARIFHHKILITFLVEKEIEVMSCYCRVSLLQLK